MIYTNCCVFIFIETINILKHIFLFCQIVIMCHDVYIIHKNVLFFSNVNSFNIILLTSGIARGVYLALIIH